MRVLTLALLFAAGPLRALTLEAPAAPSAPSPALARFFAAAETAPSRFTWWDPALLKIQSLRLEALQSPESAGQDEDRLYNLFIPGLDALPTEAREALVRLERRRSGLLVRVESLESSLGPADGRRESLASVKKGIVDARLSADLDRLESDLNAMFPHAASAAAPTERLAALERIERRASFAERARFQSLYGSTGAKASTPAGLSGLYDGGAYALPGPAPLAKAKTTAPNYSGELAKPVIRNPFPAGGTPPPSPEAKPVGMDASFWDKPFIRKVVGLVDRFGEAFGVYDLLRTAGAADPRAFVLALIRNESLFNPAIVSPAGAVGLMQVMPGTARGYGENGDLRDITVNIRTGMKCLRDCLGHVLQYGGDLRHALAAYNAGEGRVIIYKRNARGEKVFDHIQLPRITETKNYISWVLKTYGEYTTPSAGTDAALALR